jgi:hypothetical protein
VVAGPSQIKVSVALTKEEGKRKLLEGSLSVITVVPINNGMRRFWAIPGPCADFRTFPRRRLDRARDLLLYCTVPSKSYFFGALSLLPIMSEPENDPPPAYEQYDASVNARSPSPVLPNPEEGDPTVLDIASDQEAVTARTLP